MSIERSIMTAVGLVKQRNWERLYMAIDLHDTIIPSSYEKENNLSFFPYAKETLKLLTEMKAMKLILFTSSFDEQLQPVYKFLKDNDIVFDYTNENPEVPNTEHGNFTDKFYYNILIDDKAGFDANEDWIKVYNIFTTLKEVL